MVFLLKHSETGQKIISQISVRMPLDRKSKGLEVPLTTTAAAFTTFKAGKAHTPKTIRSYPSSVTL